MNGNRMGFVAVMIVFVLGTVASAQAERPYIGVRLDPAPLPGLVVTHLKLKPEQGIRIRNVNVSSPADKIGLERDDIIVRFQGEDVTDLDRFVDAVKDAGIGTEVSLHVIHEGERKVLEFQLEPLEGDLKWKYPLEPEAVTSWQPGRFFKVGPEGQNWTTFQIDELPDVDVEVKKFFNQRHVYRHSTDGEDYTITIEGDPRDESSQITVQSGDTKHSTKVGELDALPQKYREAAEDAVEGAKKSSRGRVRMKQFSLPKPPEPEVYRQYMREFKIPRLDVQPWSQKKDEMLEKLQKQMERL
ncbi:MAG: PDZ domain-containing protein, partial [Planctomycetota bacterium]